MTALWHKDTSMCVGVVQLSAADEQNPGHVSAVAVVGALPIAGRCC
jgi:hypothetical protein